MVFDGWKVEMGQIVHLSTVSRGPLRKMIWI